jgi:polysaccharide biosynthesis/export protein
MKKILCVLNTALIVGFCCIQGQLFAQSPNALAVPTDKSKSPINNISTTEVNANRAIGTVEAEYKIGSQDLMEVTVFGQPELTRTVRVNSAGDISLPLIGTIAAVGLTGQQLEQRIAASLGERYLQNPQVTVFMKEFTTLRFTVEGAVNKPGVYPLTGQMTLLRALAVAGGQGQLSDLSEVMLFRITDKGERQTLKYDADKVRSGEQADPLIQNDDLVVVKRSKARTALRDSLFRDILDTINPIPLLK